MRWSIKNGEAVSGPFDEHELPTLIRARLLTSKSLVAPEGAAEWLEVNASPLAHWFRQSQKVELDPDWKLKFLRALALSTVPVLIIGAVVAGMISGSKSTPPPPSGEDHGHLAFPDPPKPVVDDATRLGRANHIEDALPILRQHFENHNGPEPSEAAVLTGLWLHRKLLTAYYDFDAMPDSAIVEVMKDIDSYRGKKLCSRGTIGQIYASHAYDATLWLGVLVTPNINLVRFVAAGSTDGIVADSTARFCGIVVGLHGYENLSGGSSIAVETVGVFDPAN
jgi:hypothetical protein